MTLADLNMACGAFDPATLELAVIPAGTAEWDGHHQVVDASLVMLAPATTPIVILDYGQEKANGIAA